MADTGKTNKAKKKETKKETISVKVLLKHLGLAVACAFAALCIIMFLLKLITRHNRELEVPSFINMTMEEAQQVAAANHMRIEITDSVYINRMEPGAIYRQNPKEGSMVKKNRRILLTINAKLAKTVQMPSLVGYSLRQAQSELVANQLRVGNLIYRQDLATNNVLEQHYNGSIIAPGRNIPVESRIDLVLGLNDRDTLTYIPQLKGTPYSRLKATLTENSLNLASALFDNTVQDYSDSLEAMVYRQIPAYSDSVRIKMGSAVTVYLTKDKSLLEIPEKSGEEL